MQSVTVIKHRYVIQNILLCFISRLVVPPLHPFLLQAAEEALHNSVGPAMRGERRNRSTGQRKGNNANPSTGQTGATSDRIID